MPRREADPPPSERRLDVLGQVNLKGKPFVKMTWGDEEGQLTPGESVNMGIRCIQAAIEAERDAAVVNGMRERGMEDEVINGLLLMLRDSRGQVDPDPREDVKPPEEGQAGA